MTPLPVGTRFLSCVARDPCTLVEPGQPHRDYWVGHARRDDGSMLLYAIVRKDLLETKR